VGNKEVQPIRGSKRTEGSGREENIKLNIIKGNMIATEKVREVIKTDAFKVEYK